MENRDDLATILTLENGKPLQEAKTEISVAASYFDYYAEEIKAVTSEKYQSKNLSTIFNKYEPVGVCVMITPWNFPSSMIARKIAPAIAVGCSVIVKPDPQTPYSTIALANLSVQAGLPSNVLQVVPACAEITPIIGDLLSTHPSIKKLSFTGSTAIGKLLMERASGTVKRLSLELGGHAPFIVLGDAEIDQAVDGIVKSRFRNAGQTCICANRIYVHRTIYHAVLEKLITKIQSFSIGSGLSELTTMGPLINFKARDELLQRISDAVKEGAKIAYGGNALHIKGLNGAFMQPTLIVDLPCSSNLLTQEIFGPVLVLCPFETDDEVLALANNSIYGLAGYIFAKDIDRAFLLAERLEVGMVGINETTISMADAPFGGIKQSGFGREGSKVGLFEYLQLKTFHYHS